MNIKNNLLSFQNEFREICTRVGRKLEDVQIVYATKYLDSDRFVAFLDILKQKGIVSLIGENRVQEAERKMVFVRQNRPELLSFFTPVLIGNLQTNKINKAISLFNELQAVDSSELARQLDKRLKGRKAKMPIFLEVNVSGEERKHGFSPVEIDRVITFVHSLPSLQLKGLMTMAPHTQNPEEVRPIFYKLRKLADQYNLLTSMGMSNDWRVAVEEGTDMIRIGSKIFSAEN